MSLVSDFSHYYCGTWIAERRGNLNIPLFVMNVFQQGEFSRDDFSHEAEMALMFEAERWVKTDSGFNRTAVQIGVFNPNLVLESPDVGYLQHGRNMVSWTHINPVRQRAKGLMGNKLRGVTSLGRNISGEMVYNLFNPSFEGLLTRFIFINPSDGLVYYKGAHVGRVLLSAGHDSRGRQTVQLLDMFKHIQSDFNQYTVELVESL